MTGYGRAKLENDQREINVEIRSVNHRYLDLNIKVPRLYAYLEDMVKKTVQSVLVRGKTDIYISIKEKEGSDVRISPNMPVVEGYLKAAKDISDRFGLSMDDLKLSDVIRAVEGAATEGAVLNGFTTVVDAGKCKMYIKNFGEFFNDQVENAGCIIVSHADSTPAKKVEEAVELLRAHNATAVIVSTPWNQLTGDQLREAMERRDTLEAELSRLAAEEDDEDEDEHEHHHHHHEDEDDHDEHEHHHHHHEDEDDHDEHEHHHHHDGDEDEDEDECGCGCCHHDHEGHHHHHHDADEVFVSCGAETTVRFDRAALESMLTALCDEGKYGTVLRAKGIVAPADSASEGWIHFDYVPGEPDVRTGAPAVIGRLCVIGSGLKVDALSALFGVTLHKSEED